MCNVKIHKIKKGNKVYKYGFLIFFMTHFSLYSFEFKLCKDNYLWNGIPLCERNGLWNERTRDTPLCFAIRNNNREEAEVLLNTGCDINEKNNFEHTPLMLAAAYNYTSLCNWLLNKGADLNKHTHEGTALSQAVRYNQIETAIFLIEQKADINQGNQFDYNTPLDQAATYGRRLMIELLLKHGVDVNPKCPPVDYNPLGKAIFWGHYNIVLLLIKAGANISQAQEVISSKESYLHMAAKSNQIKIVKLLLRFGADVSQVDSNNRMPIDVATNVKMKNLLDNAEQYRCLLLCSQHLKKKHSHFAYSLFVNEVCEWLGFN